MLVAEKEKVNWAFWFSQKLQNKIIAIQRKVGKIGNTLTRPALTIMGHYFLKQRVIKRIIYQDQEEKPKQEREDDYGCQCNPASEEEGEEEKIRCNHK